MTRAPSSPAGSRSARRGGAFGAAGAALLLAFTASVAGCSGTDAGEFLTWRVAGGDPGTTRYSALLEITPANVGELEVAWVHRSGSPGNVQANPLVIGRTLLTCSPEM